MPAKKKTVKAKSAKLKLVPKAKSQIEKKKVAVRKPKIEAKKKAEKPAPKASGGNIFWKVLEMRKQEREARLNKENGQHDHSDHRNVYSDKHAKFGRFAGPRRRAA